MSDERWQRLKHVFHDALEQPEDARGAFLDRECAGDADLRAEIESLLASHDEADGFLSRPAMDEAARALAADPPGSRGDASAPIASWARSAAAAWASSTGPCAPTTTSRSRSRSRSCAAGTDGRRRAAPPARAPDPGPPRPPEHRGLFDGGTTDDGPALPGDGARRGRAHHRVLRGARPGDARAAGALPRGLRRRPVRAPQPGRPPRPQARRTSWSARTDVRSCSTSASRSSWRPASIPTWRRRRRCCR